MDPANYDAVFNRGKRYWIKLTNLNDSQEFTLFQECESVYNNLFPEEYREPFENFERYIKQNEIYDQFYVGLCNNRVVGMLFFSVYPDWIFISYGGIDYFQLKQGGIYSLVCAGLLGTIYDQIKSSDCKGALFELEKINTEDIVKVAMEKESRLKEIKRNRILNRIKTTYKFQNYGTWKIPFINYLQPKPGTLKDSREIAMHLMFIPKKISNKAPVLSGQDVKDILRFVYEKFYYDGFEETGDWLFNSKEKTIIYLSSLNQISFQDYPESSELIKVELNSFFNKTSECLKDNKYIEEIYNNNQPITAGHSFDHFAKPLRAEMKIPYELIDKLTMQKLHTYFGKLTNEFAIIKTELKSINDQLRIQNPDRNDIEEMKKMLVELRNMEPSAFDSVSNFVLDFSNGMTSSIWGNILYALMTVG